jgi:GxxExxY protein
MALTERDSLTEKIIGACYDVHTALGPGFVERIYVQALRVALRVRGLAHASERQFEVAWQGTVVGTFRVDLCVEDQVIVEVKAIAGIMPRVFEAQVISYLKASGLKTGLLVNFGGRSCQVRRLMRSSPSR